MYEIKMKKWLNDPSHPSPFTQKLADLKTLKRFD